MVHYSQVSADISCSLLVIIHTREFGSLEQLEGQPTQLCSKGLFRLRISDVALRSNLREINRGINLPPPPLYDMLSLCYRAFQGRKVHVKLNVALISNRLFRSTLSRARVSQEVD